MLGRLLYSINTHSNDINTGDNATLPILPDPCIENPSLPECASSKPKPPTENLPPPNVDDTGDEDDSGSGGDGGDSKVDNGISGDAEEAAPPSIADDTTRSTDTDTGDGDGGGG